MEKHKQRKKVFAWVVFGLELLIVMCLLIRVGSAALNTRTYYFDSEDAKCYFADDVQYEAGVWSVVGDINPGDQEILDIRGCEAPLWSSYKLHIEYSCDENQYGIIQNIRDTQINKFELLSQDSVLEYDFEYKAFSGPVSLWMLYSGEGAYSIRNIQMTETPYLWLRYLVTAVAFFAFVDLIIAYRDKIMQEKKVFFLLTAILFVASLPLFHYGLNEGHDLDFHLMRIEGLSQEISRGNWYPYILSDCIEGNGYPVPIYYSNLFLYIPAIARNLGFDLNSSYKIFLFIVNSATLFTSYYCFRKMFDSKKIGIVLCAAYMMCPYRLTDLYIRSAVGEYSAMVFLPLIAYAVWRIYAYDSKDKKEWISTGFLLTLGMSGLIESHILTTEMVVVFLLLIFVICIKKSIRLRALVIYASAVIETILLNAFFIVPFLMYYQSEYTNIKRISEGAVAIQKDGAYISQLFSFFSNVNGLSQHYTMNNRMMLTIGIVLMVCVILAFGLWIVKKATKTMVMLSCLSLLALWLSTDLFPWDFVSAKIPLGNSLAQVQYPWRFLGIAMIISVVLLGCMLREIENGKLNVLKLNGKMNSICIICLLICYVSSIIYLSLYSNEVKSTIHPRDIRDINMTTSIMGGEYLLDGTDEDLVTREVSVEGDASVQVVNRFGTSMVIECHNIEAESIVTLPIFNYKGYLVTDSEGNEIEIYSGDNNRITFVAPAGYDGNLYVEFVVRRLWNVSMIISGVALIAFVVSAIILHQKRKIEVESAEGLK